MLASSLSQAHQALPSPGHFLLSEPSHHTGAISMRAASTRLSMASWDSGVV